MHCIRFHETGGRCHCLWHCKTKELKRSIGVGKKFFTVVVVGGGVVVYDIVGYLKEVVVSHLKQEQTNSIGFVVVGSIRREV